MRDDHEVIDVAVAVEIPDGASLRGEILDRRARWHATGGGLVETDVSLSIDDGGGLIDGIRHDDVHQAGRMDSGGELECVERGHGLAANGHGNWLQGISP